MKRMIPVTICLVLALAACEPKKPAVSPVVDAAPDTVAAPLDAGAALAPDLAQQEEELPDHVKESRKYGHIPIAGETTPAQVVEKFGTWKSAREQAQADAAGVEKLAAVPKGAKLTIIFGTWCPDCYQTLPPLWATFDAAGERLPFEVQYVAVDEQFRAGELGQNPMGVERIPTLIVSRDGQEVGRIIETTPGPVLDSLVALLDGSQKGIISATPSVRAKYKLDGE